MQFDRRAFIEGGRKWYSIWYTCAECGTHWNSEWSCTCDDDCPECGTVMEAESFDDISHEFTGIA